MNRTINACMNWTVILAAVTGIALTVKAVVDSIKTAAIDWPTGKINMDKARLELEMLRKKAGQEIAASSGTSPKPDYKEHAPPPKPSKVPKWFMLPLTVSTLIYIGLLYYLTYTGSFSTSTLGQMFICVFWLIVNAIIFVHRLLENRINDESAWMRWVTLEMAHMQIHFTGYCFLDVFKTLADVANVAKLQADITEKGILGVHKVAKLQIDATAAGFRDVNTVTKLQSDSIEQNFTGVTNVAKLQVQVMEQGFREIKTLIERRYRKSSR